MSAARGTGGSRLLLVPGLALLAVGFAVPMAVVLWMSLRRLGGFSLAAYAQTLGSSVFLDIVLHTLVTSAMVTVLCVALGYPLAYFVTTRARRHAGLIMALVAVPYLTSILIRSYAWVAILSNNGLVNRFLLALSLIDEPLPMVFNEFGSYVGMVHILLPMVVLPIYAAMQRIDPALLRPLPISVALQAARLPPSSCHSPGLALRPVRRWFSSTPWDSM